jgi:hypothetical protein
MCSAFRHLLAACVLALMGCATSSPPTGPLFHAVEAPPSGKARLYVLRPKFTVGRESESPSLVLDGSSVATLQRDEYQDFVVSPGNHLLELAPGRLEQEVRRRRLTIDAHPDSTYFVAYWPVTEATTGVQFVPMAGAVPFLVLPSQGTRIANVRFELVPQDQAISVLESMTQAVPKK